MAKYRVLIKRSAQKELELILKASLLPIAKIIASLANDPRPIGSEKLSGDEKYRFRKGPYRIVYSIEENELVIWVVKIAHRKKVYR